MKPWWQNKREMSVSNESTDGELKKCAENPNKRRGSHRHNNYCAIDSMFSVIQGHLSYGNVELKHDQMKWKIGILSPIYFWYGEPVLPKLCLEIDPHELMAISGIHCITCRKGMNLDTELKICYESYTRLGEIVWKTSSKTVADAI